MKKRFTAIALAFSLVFGSIFVAYGADFKFVTENVPPQDYEMIQRLEKHNKFGANDYLIYGYCRNELDQIDDPYKYYVKGLYVTYRSSVKTFGTNLYEYMAEGYGCGTEPEIFYVIPNGGVFRLRSTQ